MKGLRDCVKWMQGAEQEQGYFYDLVVRLRDDTFAFADWIFDSTEMKNALTRFTCTTLTHPHILLLKPTNTSSNLTYPPISADLGSYRGINDHNLVLDRKWADVLFRGLTEDYYFNKSNRHVMWGNPEHHIYQVSTAYHVNIRTATMCKQPLIPLRANQNSTHWLLHPAYTDKMKDSCVEGYEENKVHSFPFLIPFFSLYTIFISLCYRSHVLPPCPHEHFVHPPRPLIYHPTNNSLAFLFPLYVDDYRAASVRAVGWISSTWASIPYTNCPHRWTTCALAAIMYPLLYCLICKLL